MSSSRTERTSELEILWPSNQKLKQTNSIYLHLELQRILEPSKPQKRRISTPRISMAADAKSQGARRNIVSASKTGSSVILRNVAVAIAKIQFRNSIIATSKMNFFRTSATSSSEQINAYYY